MQVRGQESSKTGLLCAAACVVRLRSGRDPLSAVPDLPLRLVREQMSPSATLHRASV